MKYIRVTEAVDPRLGIKPGTILPVYTAHRTCVIAEIESDQVLLLHSEYEYLH